MKPKRELNAGLVLTKPLRRLGWLVAAILAATVPLVSAQTIIKNFTGLNFTDVTGLGTGGTPPDTMGAAGTNQFVEFINGAFAVYDKAGIRQSLISDKTFWLNAGISSTTMAAGLSDTRIIYDAGSGRWFASEITTDPTANRILVARSDSSNPSGTWKAVNFLGNSGFADYDTLGVDSAAVYIGVNDFSARGAATGVSFFSIPKADLLATSPTTNNMTRFDNLNDQIYGFTLQGVCNPTAGPGHGVMLAIDNAAFNFFDRTTINNPGTAGATLSARVRISNAYDGGPVPAAQPGGATVDALDDRFSGAVRQSGSNIFIANTVLQGSRDAVHWLVLNEFNNTIVGEGVFSDPNYDFFQPSIAPNSKGQFLMAFNRSGSTAPAGDIGIYGAVGSVNGSTVTMGASFLIQTGAVSNFTISFDTAPYRWGDFSATMVDPTDDSLFWTIQEIPATATSWGTQITLISLASNRPSLAINPGQYVFAYFVTNTTPGPRFGQVTAVSNLVSVQLSWPLSTDPGYTLQSATNLAPAMVWTTVTNPVTVSLNQNTVTLPQVTRTRLFRLQK